MMSLTDRYLCCIGVGVQNVVYSLTKFAACACGYFTNSFDARFSDAMFYFVSVYCLLQFVLSFFILTGVFKKFLTVLKWSVVGLLVLGVFCLMINWSFFFFVKREPRIFFVGFYFFNIVPFFSASILFGYYAQLKRGQK